MYTKNHAVYGDKSLRVPRDLDMISLPVGTELRHYSAMGEHLRDIGVQQLDVRTTQPLTAFTFPHNLIDRSDRRLCCWYQNSYFHVYPEDVIDRGPNGYVYMIHAVGSNRYKIGYSNDPIRRFREIEGSLPEQSPFDLRLIAVSDPIMNARRREKEWHDLLVEFRVRGEWFELDLAQARSVAGGIMPGVMRSSDRKPSLSSGFFENLAIPEIAIRCDIKINLMIKDLEALYECLLCMMRDDEDFEEEDEDPSESEFF